MPKPAAAAAVAGAPSTSELVAAAKPAARLPDSLDTPLIVRVLQESAAATLAEHTSFAGNERVRALAKDASDLALARFLELEPTCKYIVNCVITQNNGTGLSMVSSAFWNAERDGSWVHRYESPVYVCLLTVYILSL